MQPQIDRRRYDTKTLSILDTFGAYFIDRYYNHIYLAACDQVNEGRAKNITDAYRGNVINYMTGIAKKEYYVSTVKHLHEFYQDKSGFGSIVLSEFENKVLCAFIPQEFYRSFNNDQKDKVLRDIIVKTTNELGTVVIGRNMLPRIIDDHRNPAIVEQLQDITLDILLNQRETYYMQFAKQVSDTNAGDKVSRHIVDKLKQALMDEKQSRISMETDRDRALAIANSLANKMTSMERELIGLRKQVSELVAVHRVQPVVQVQTTTQPVAQPTTRPVKPVTQQPTTQSVAIQPVKSQPFVQQPATQSTTHSAEYSIVASEESEDNTSRSRQQEMIRNRFNTVSVISDQADVAESEFDADAWL